MNSIADAPDLFTLAATDPAADFGTAFLIDLLESDNGGTSEETRQRHGLAGDNATGATVKAFSRAGFIQVLGVEIARSAASRGHMLRKWGLTAAGRAEAERRAAR